MADEKWGTDPALSEELSEHPERFDFFQAVRLLLWHGGRQAADAPDALTAAVGYKTAPDREGIRFRVLPTFRFPQAQVTRVAMSRSAREPSELETTVMGLVGPQGVLPMHYSATLIEQCLTERDGQICVLRDFLDLLQHRAVSFFYRAWQKQRLPVAFEQNVLAPPPESAGDPVTPALEGLGGFGLRALQGRVAVDRAALVYYVGHFAHFPRSAIALESMLADYFALPVQVVAFVGQWLQLPRRDQTRLSAVRSPGDANCELGHTAVVGTRMWSRQTKFRVRVGPCGLARFNEFLPGGDGLRRLGDLVRLFVGQQHDFDVQLLLLQAEVPATHVRFDTNSRLGWNAWLRATPATRDATDAVFALPEDSGGWT